MIVLLGLLRSRDLCPVSGRICGLSREEDSAGRRRSSADRGQRSQAGGHSSSQRLFDRATRALSIEQTAMREPETAH
jgi:hypothetical protein